MKSAWHSSHRVNEWHQTVAGIVEMELREIESPLLGSSTHFGRIREAEMFLTT